MRARLTSGKRSRTISAAAAPMPASCAPSSAPRQPLEGGLPMNAIASRRELLKGGGAMIVAFSFAGPVSQALAQGGTPAAAAAGAQGAATKPVALTDVDSFL